MNAIAILADTQGSIDFTSLSGWWELAKSVGPGATLAMGFGLWWMAAELTRRNQTIKDKDTDLKNEVSYSKELTTKQLTVISELTTLVRAIDKRDMDSVTVADGNTKQILSAIKSLETTVIQHALNHHSGSKSAAA